VPAPQEGDLADEHHPAGGEAPGRRSIRGVSPPPPPTPTPFSLSRAPGRRSSTGASYTPHGTRVLLCSRDCASITRKSVSVVCVDDTAMSVCVVLTVSYPCASRPALPPVCRRGHQHQQRIDVTRRSQVWHFLRSSHAVAGYRATAERTHAAHACAQVSRVP
jgi:hypothetical protein